MSYLIALFGEAEKGALGHPYLFGSLPQMALTLGNPPTGSQGLHFAVQTLLYKRKLLFFRVESEGFATSDYLSGLKYLRCKAALHLPSAICLPGVGDRNIIEDAANFCKQSKSFLIITPRDLFDFLMS